VYAVATQLFGKTLFKLLARSPDPFMHEVECDKICKGLWRQVNLQVTMGLLGAAAYRGINHLMPLCLERVSAPRPRAVSSSMIANGSASDGRGPDGDAALGRHGDWSRQASPERSSTGPRTSLEMSGEQAQAEEQARPNVAISMWLGLVLDGIPESVMLGFMTNGGEVTFSFLLAVFVANFPEAFAGASALQRQGMPAVRNVALWSSVFLLTGTLAMVGSLVMPVNIPKHSWIQHLTDDVTVVLQGFTGGAMLAMVATAMMPEAYHGSQNAAGNMFVLGFGLSVFIDGLGARFGHPQTVVMNHNRNRTFSHNHHHYHHGHGGNASQNISYVGSLFAL